MIIRKLFSFFFSFFFLFCFSFLMVHVEKSDKSCFCLFEPWNVMLRLVLWFGVTYFVCSFVSIVVVVVDGAVDMILTIQDQLETRVSLLLVSSCSSISKNFKLSNLAPRVTPCCLHFLHTTFHEPWLINGRKPLITSKNNFGLLLFEWSRHFCVESLAMWRWYLFSLNEDVENFRRKKEKKPKFSYHPNWTIQFLSLFQSFVCRARHIISYMQWICKSILQFHSKMKTERVCNFSFNRGTFERISFGFSASTPYVCVCVCV